MAQLLRELCIPKSEWSAFSLAIRFDVEPGIHDCYLTDSHDPLLKDLPAPWTVITCCNDPSSTPNANESSLESLNN